MGLSATETVPKAYLILILFAGTLLSPPPHSIVALILLALQIYSVYKPLKPGLSLALTFSTLILVPLSLEPSAGKLFSPLLTVPAIPLLDKSLRENAMEQRLSRFKDGRKATTTTKTLAITLFIMLISSVVLSNQTLTLTCSLLTIYLAAISLYVLAKVLKRPLDESKTLCRVVVGENAKTSMTIRGKAAVPLHVLLKAQCDWLHLQPSQFTLAGEGEAEISIAVKPPLAGPSKVQVQALAVDVWGLTQTGQTLEPLELHIIPRAKYAEWLAKRFLEQTAPGGGVAAEVPPSRMIRAARLGVEYYGSRPYQPGDRLRDVDWKRTLKLHELIVKEYAGAHEQPAIVAANLTASSPEEADELAYTFITSALTLAEEGLPTALAAYNEREVIEAVPPINPREALKKALKLTKGIVVMKHPKRVLEPPNVRSLLRSIEQLQRLEGEPARRLSEILKFEHEALQDNARRHPVSKALEKEAKGTSPPATIIVVSLLNHDAEALSVTLENMRKRGYNTIRVEAASKPLKKASHNMPQGT